MSPRDGYETKVVGIAKIQTEIIIGGESQTILLRDVMFEPRLMCNLLSVNKMRNTGLQLVFVSGQKRNGVRKIINKAQKGSNPFQTERSEKRLYEICMPMRTRHNAESLLSCGNTQQLRPERLGHVGQKTIQKTLSMVTGIRMEKATEVSCDACKSGKLTRQPRPQCEQI